MSASDAMSLRLDKWLWFARLARTRSLAARFCAAGYVCIGERAVPKPHHLVRIGDWVEVTNGRTRRRLRVVALGSRRGPAAEARSLYDEPAAPEPVTDAAAVSWTPLLDEENWA